ncbi:MAG: hypothetical protein ABI921_11115 [Panacibacter sp.]
MKSRIAIAFRLIISLSILKLASCNSLQSGNWETIKKTKKIYPKDTIVIFKHSVLQDTQLIWINTSYKNYPYKKFCKNKVQVTFDLTDALVKKYLAQDSLNIAYMLLDKFKEMGVSHLAGQTINYDQLLIYLYTEDGLNPIGTLSDFTINSNGYLQTDEEWTAYYNLLNEK